MMSKLSLRGKTSSSKLSSWVQPSFGDLLGGSGLSSFSAKAESKSRARPASTEDGAKRPRKRIRDPQTSQLDGVSGRRGTAESHDEPWVDVYAPQSQAELAVHKKKVEEVESWLRVRLALKCGDKDGAILLLTGPSGCGKTATVHVLSKELGCQIQEWTNPITSEAWTDESSRQNFDPDSRFNHFQGSSQTASFQDFLLRANKYTRLQMSRDEQGQERKIILVEDFPNQFYRQPGNLHGVLRRFVRTGRCPLVFVVSDSLSGDTSSRRLFPKEVQEELGIQNISFNPVAHTSMIRALSRIASLEAGKSAGKISVPGKEVLEELCSGSSGDIRSAINSLQFSSFSDLSLEKKPWSSRKGSSISKTSVRTKGRSRAAKPTTGADECPAMGGKDASLFLFRALGKILYCKRESFEASEVPKLPAHLAEHQRDKLLMDPELVVERSHMSGELFSLYLHQNYLDFFSETDDVARASEYLSDADFLTAEWSSRSTMLPYGSSVATRGLVHSNCGRTTAGFKPLHKPHWLHINKTHRENVLTAQSLFVSFCLSPVGLTTELVPYLAKLSNPMRNQAQITFIQDVGHLSRRMFPGRLKLEALGDKDPGRLDSDSDHEETRTAVTLGLSSIQDGPGELPASQPRPTGAGASLEDEDALIEEYDSD